MVWWLSLLLFYKITKEKDMKDSTCFMLLGVMLLVLCVYSTLIGAHWMFDLVFCLSGVLCVVTALEMEINND